MMLSRSWIAVIALTLSIIVANPHAQAGNATGLQIDRITGGLSSPVFLTHAGDGSGRKFVVQQRGVIRIIDGSDSLAVTPFLNISAKVSSSGGERGLFAMAFHPAYAINGQFYVHYTRASDHASIIERYEVSQNNPDAADPNSGVVVYGPITQPESNHNGGWIAFGPDEMLYFTLGDGGSGYDPHGTIGNGQNMTNPLGKVLRIDVSTQPYSIPEDNPFVGVAGAAQEIFAYGLRNTWRASFDRVTGRLFAGDVGQDRREEIDIIVNGGNYGWRCREGLIVTPSIMHGENCNTTAFIDPIWEYAHPQSGAARAVTGGYIYRSTVSPALYGKYIYGDYQTGEIWKMTETETGWENELMIDTPYFVSSFGEDQEGELYFTSLTSGEVFRIRDTMVVDTQTWTRWEIYE